MPADAEQEHGRGSHANRREWLTGVVECMAGLQPELQKAIATLGSMGLIRMTHWLL